MNQITLWAHLVSFSLCLSVSFLFYLSLFLFPSFSVCLSVSHTLYLSISLCQFLSLHLFLSVSLPLFVSPPLSHKAWHLQWDEGSKNIWHSFPWLWNWTLTYFLPVTSDWICLQGSGVRVRSPSSSDSWWYFYSRSLQGWEVLLFGGHTLAHTVVMVPRCGMNRILTDKDQLLQPSPRLCPAILSFPVSLLFTLKWGKDAKLPENFYMIISSCLFIIIFIIIIHN